MGGRGWEGEELLNICLFFHESIYKYPAEFTIKVFFS